MKITIGIPAYNEEANIAALLENLSRQAAKFDHEIVVVSDGSSDRTCVIVQGFCQSYSSMKLIVHSKRLGKAQAINSILSVAKGEVIILVSGDTQPASGSINALLDRLAEDPTAGLVWAWPKPITPDSAVLVHVGQVCYHLHQNFMTKLDHIGELKHAAGELIAFRPGLLRELPSECVNDDSYLAMATTSKGLKVRLAGNTETDFVFPKTIPEYVEQRKRWLYGHMQTRRIAGEFPQVLEFSLTRRPKLVVAVIAEELKKKPRDLFYVAAAILLEIIAIGYAFLESFSTKHHVTWKIIDSSKRFP